MKTLSQAQGGTGRQKRLIVFGLYLFAAGSTLSGIFFGVYSLLGGVSFRVLNTNVPGVVFGVVVIYFGVRSILSVNRLKAELYKDQAKFSWSNFRKEKPVKNR